MLRFRRTAPAERTYEPGRITVTDVAVRERVEFIGLTPADLGVVATWRTQCEAALDRLVDEFYAHIRRTSATWEVIERHTSVERQRPMIRRYILTMFQGSIDDAYVGYRRHLGVVHDGIDLDSNWYVGMYEVIRRVLDDAVQQGGATPAERQRFASALSRLIQVDIALVITALTDSRRARIESEREAAHEFVGALGKVLGRVAERDLTARVEGEFPPQYRPVVDALERTLENLTAALGDVAGSAEQVAGAARAIAEGSSSLASQASDQAAGVEEVSAAVVEVNAMTSRTAENALEASRLSDDGQSSVARGEVAMRQLQEAIARIDESAARTSRIVKSIDEIAFQTNLLALNAAVEAARAGDAGRGFAVVADEVRALALRSAEAAKTTSDLIEAAREHSAHGVELSASVAGHFGEIGGKVRRVHEVMQEIAEAAKEQRDGIDSITETIGRIGEVTQRVAASAEESAAAAEELTGQSESMNELLAAFTLAEQQRVAAMPMPAMPAMPAMPVPARQMAPRMHMPASRPAVRTERPGSYQRR